LIFLNKIYFLKNTDTFSSGNKKTIGNVLMEKLFSLLKKDEVYEEASLLYFKKILYSLLNVKGYEVIFIF